MDLSQKTCVACEGGEPTLTPREVQEYLGYLSEPWEVVEAGKKIRREFVFGDFTAAIAFINRIAEIAEQEGHHPDIHNFYNKVVCELWTHAIGGLHKNDFIMAEKINKTEHGKR